MNRVTRVEADLDWQRPLADEARDDYGRTPIVQPNPKRTLVAAAGPEKVRGEDHQVG